MPAIAVLLVVSSTAGLPFGPHAGVAEAVDTAGICALLLECYVIMGAAWAWMQDYEPEAVSRFRSALVLLGANGVIAGTVCVGVASSLHHGDHHAPLEAQRGTPHHHTSPVAPPQSGVPDEPAAPAPEDAGLPVGGHGTSRRRRASARVTHPSGVDYACMFRLYRTGLGSAAAQRRRRCRSTSSAKVCRALRIIRAVPSGCRQDPRPSTRRTVRRISRTTSSAARPKASSSSREASRGRPLRHGPHWRALCSARYPAISAVRPKAALRAIQRVDDSRAG